MPFCDMIMNYLVEMIYLKMSDYYFSSRCCIFAIDLTQLIVYLLM